MTPESIDARTVELVEALSRDVNGVAGELRNRYRLFPDSFYRIAGGGLSLSSTDSFVFQLMLTDTECCRYLCDTTLLDLRAAVDLARRLFTVAPDFDIRLARAAVQWVRGDNHRNALRRCLFILDSLVRGTRINFALVQLISSNDGAVRSKVFELLVRSSLNEQNIRIWLQDPAPRIRANLLECLAKTNPCPEWVRYVLIDHLGDPHGRIAANAAVGLFRLRNEAEATARLTEMALHEDSAIRCSAAWAMGELPKASVFDLLNKLRTDPHARVRWNALRSLSRVHKIAPKLAEAPAKPEEVAPEEVAPGEETHEQVTHEIPAVHTHKSDRWL